MRITTLPVYSKLAAELELPVPVRRQLPSGWCLSQHQLDTNSVMSHPVFVSERMNQEPPVCGSESGRI